MTGILLILASLALWFAFNMVVGLIAFNGDIREAIRGTMFVTAAVAVIGAFCLLFGWVVHSALTYYGV